MQIIHFFSHFDIFQKRPYYTHITSAVYNYLGTEILASYSDDDIYLFDNINYTNGKFLHRYEGHRYVF